MYINQAFGDVTSLANVIKNKTNMGLQQPTAPLNNPPGMPKRKETVYGLMNQLMAEARMVWAVQQAAAELWAGMMDECVMIFGLSPALELNPHVGICPLGNGVVGAGLLQMLVKGSVKVAPIAGSGFRSSSRAYSHGS